MTRRTFVVLIAFLLGTVWGVSDDNTYERLTAPTVARVGSAGIGSTETVRHASIYGYSRSFLPVGNEILVLPLSNQIARIVALGADVENGVGGGYIPRDRNNVFDYTRTDGQSITTSTLKEGDLVMTPGSIDEGGWCNQIQLNQFNQESSTYCLTTVDALYGVITQSRQDCNGFLCARTTNPFKPNGGDVPVVSINDITAAEEARIVQIEVHVSPMRPNQVITVSWIFEEGSATNGEDFTCPEPGTTTIPAGTASAFLPVAVLSDERSEGTETFRVRLTGATGAVIDPFSNAATIYIVDNDLPSQLSVTPSLQNVDEGDSIVWTVSLDRPTTEAFSATFVLEGVGARPATVSGANADVNSPGTFILNFPAGETTQTVTVTTVNDAAVEFTETLQIRINPISALSVNVNQGTALANIISNNRASLVLSPSTTTVVEGQSRTMTLQYAGGVTLPEPVVVTLTYNAGTATAGDYATNVASVTIPAGVNSVTFVAATNPDGIAEGTETYTIVATQTDSTLVTLNPTQTTSTISITDP